MTETTALIIELVLIALAGTGAAIAGLVYVRTNEEHGGIICAFLIFLAASGVADLWAATSEVLK